MSSRERSRRRKSRPNDSSSPAPTSEIIADSARVAEVAAALAQRSIIAFDTEFLREKTFYPQLGLLQVADRESVWLIDPLGIDREGLQPLLDVFTNPKILKVAHSAEQDQECLHHEYGILAAPLFDTSIGAALSGRGDQIGLAPLLRKTLKVDLPKGHTRTNWLKRPLPEAMAEYAAEDVRNLVKLGELLLADLERRGRKAWALEVSAEMARPERFESNGEAVATKLAANSRLSSRDYAVLIELAHWREKRVRRVNIPRRWLADDQSLLQLTRAKPRSDADLAHFRGLGQRVRDYGASQILLAISRGLEKPEEQLTDPPRKLEPTRAEASALGVLKCFLNFLAVENDVPLRFVMDSDTPLLLLRERFDSIDALRASGLLSPGALELFGDELSAILQGRRAIKLAKGSAKLFDV